MQGSRDLSLVSTARDRTAKPRRLRSSELLRGERRIVIEHGDALYTLLHTRNDKLILIK